MFAKVLIDIKHEEVNRFFDYIIPSDMIDDLSRGMRVIVPFGNQTRMGYVISIIDHSDQATKEIIELLDVIPTIQEETFVLIDYLLQETNDLYSAIFETVVPSELTMDYFLEIRIVKPDIIDKDFYKVFDKNGVLRLSKSNHTYDYKIRKYVKLNALEVQPLWRQKATEKQLFAYQFNTRHHYERINQYPELDLLSDRHYLKHELNDFGLTDGKINTLVKHHVLMKEKVQINREIKHVYELKDKNVSLTKKQQLVYDNFANRKHEGKTYLLKGVTGSGKTELYLKWIFDVLNEHKQVLILVPEITLIAPMAHRLESAFGKIAIYHSQLSKGERFDQYMKVKRGEINIVLGTRSAVFLPLEQLGLIIIDEEHDTSYEQLEHVIYDAREVAKIRAEYHQCPLILGSATPSISTMYQALEGPIQLLTLDERPFDIEQPSLTFVDMREELRQKNTSMFSKLLKDSIQDRLDKQEQIMILFNRKGYAPFVMCRQCGYVPTCPTCGISLTYYQTNNRLKCHYCGYEESYSHTCTECHQQTMKPVGVGIEQVEREIEKIFPHADVIRMDANVTKTKGSHELIWHDFQNQKADILLGTQMIAKGLDFPNVTLVGVLMADLMLKTPSYRASEDAFMLLTQVAGRSGRTKHGEVIIQGYDLAHFAIKDVELGYDTFYKEALYERKISGYEPFNHVYQIRAEGLGYLHTYQVLFTLKKKLELYDGITVLGPVPAYIKKKGDKFRFVMTIKSSLDSKEPIFKNMKLFKEESVNLRFYPLPDCL